jgi:hypothetical protein
MQAGAAAASAGSDHGTLKDLLQVDQKLAYNYNSRISSNNLQRFNLDRQLSI